MFQSKVLVGALMISVAGVLACGVSNAPGQTGDRVALPPDSTYIKKIALDPLGQLYVVKNDNEIIQYRANGREGFRYNNNTLGRLAVVDPTNPFSMLLYYPDFQTIVLLDRTLNEKGRILLSTLGLIDIEQVALGNDNYIWLYDAVDVQLKKLDQDGNISFRSDRLNQLLQKIPYPNQLLALNTHLFLNDPASGILVFDQFGRYETTLPVYGAGSLQLINEDKLVYLREGKLYSYDLRALQESAVDLNIPCTADCQLRIGKEKVYWLEKGQLQERILRISP